MWEELCNETQCFSIYPKYNNKWAKPSNVTRAKSNPSQPKNAAKGEKRWLEEMVGGSRKETHKAKISSGWKIEYRPTLVKFG